MTAENFCYWLQGFIELTESAWNVPLPEGESIKELNITREQLREIKNHLNLVLNKKTPLYFPKDAGPGTIGGSLREFINNTPFISKEGPYCTPPRVDC